MACKQDQIILVRRDITRPKQEELESVARFQHSVTARIASKSCEALQMTYIYVPSSVHKSLHAT